MDLTRQMLYLGFVSQIFEQHEIFGIYTYIALRLSFVKNILRDKYDAYIFVMTALRD